MDNGWRNQRNPKRSYADMSHQATLSPSPVIFRDQPPAIFENHLPFLTHDGPLSRRRTSHPHNRQLEPNPRASEDMPNRSQSQQRPRLEHRASQTIIDLTDDVDEEQHTGVRLRGESIRPQRPPHLARTNTITVGNVIDLTDDIASPPSPEIQITHSRQLPPPNRSRTPPQPNAREDNNRLAQHISLLQEGAMMQAFGNFAQHLGANRLGALVFTPPNHVDHHRHFARDHDLNIQAMPGPMDYHHPALARNQKPDHKPPQAARDGFTRSPTETDIIICPSCLEELVHKKVEDGTVPVKKTSRAPSKKDREEHPFWVVKECGHVYCNTCFQFRSSCGKSPVATSFPSVSKLGSSKKTLLCAVEDCESEVRNKDRWVGVFL